MWILLFVLFVWIFSNLTENPEHFFRVNPANRSMENIFAVFKR